MPSALAAGAETPAAAAPAAPPGDLTRQQVRQLVHEAGQLMDRGDRAGAVARLQQAQALHPDPSLDYNLGIVYAELGQHPQAAQALHRFLASADRAAVLKDRLDDALHRLEDYKQTLARLKLQASLPPQAGPPVLFIDRDAQDAEKPQQRPAGSPAGKDAPTELPTKLPLWLNPGTHQVRVAASGARDYVVQVELHPGELRQLTAELLPAGELSTLVPSSPELHHASESSSLYKKWWFWTAVGGGAAAVLGLSIGLIAAGATGKLSHTAAGSDLAPVDVAR
ncbi:MAG TPA: hypothetical protein PLW65_22850 [Pseudomonadota bacterium]|nr:hypothetical protein [Pseudomonadota bacterium]